MTATHETYNEKAGSIGSILSSLAGIAELGINQHPDTDAQTDALHACAIMAERARQIAESMEHDAMAAKKSEAEQ